MTAHSRIPDWPAMMTRKTASAYLDMSEAAFEREIIAGRLPHGVLFGGRSHWYKTALDKALEAIAGGHAAGYRARFEERRDANKAA